MHKDITEILQYAIMAPSGDNSQPWRFRIREDAVEVFNIPDKDNPYLNYRQSGSYVAHGALIENMCIAALNFGYESDVRLFPKSDIGDCVASISFREASPKDGLFEYISVRHTNRKPYQERPLTQDESVYLESSTADLSFGEVLFIEDKRRKEAAARGGSVAEVVILENRMLHEYLFKDIVWSIKDERRLKSGLYIATMEFNTLQTFLFKSARYWPIMKLGMAVRFPYFIAHEDAKLYSTGAAMGLITIPDASRESYIRAGRLMQRVWLKASKLHLAFQPITATLFFAQRILANDAEELTMRHRDLLTRSYRDICDAFGVSDKIPAVMFRVGHAEPASARCSRIGPDAKLIP